MDGNLHMRIFAYCTSSEQFNLIMLAANSIHRTSNHCHTLVCNHPTPSKNFLNYFAVSVKMKKYLDFVFWWSADGQHYDSHLHLNRWSVYVARKNVFAGILHPLKSLCCALLFMALLKSSLISLNNVAGSSLKSTNDALNIAHRKLSSSILKAIQIPDVIMYADIRKHRNPFPSYRSPFSTTGRVTNNSSPLKIHGKVI